MSTLTATRGLSTFPVAGFAGAGLLSAAYGTYAVAANPSAADVIEMCWVPAGAVIVGGWIYAGDIDTNASETLDYDLGWAANGGSGTYDAADSDGLGNLGVMNGDAFANPSISAVTGNIIPVQGPFLSDGILPYFTKKTKIQITFVATAATFAAQDISVVIFYIVDPTLVVG